MKNLSLFDENLAISKSASVFSIIRFVSIILRHTDNCLDALISSAIPITARDIFLPVLSLPLLSASPIKNTNIIPRTIPMNLSMNVVESTDFSTRSIE